MPDPQLLPKGDVGAHDVRDARLPRRRDVVFAGLPLQRFVGFSRACRFNASLAFAGLPLQRFVGFSRACRFTALLAFRAQRALLL
jgi:hypothetical protein